MRKTECLWKPPETTEIMTDRVYVKGVLDGWARDSNNSVCMSV